MPGPFSLHLGQKGRYPFAWEAPQLEARLRSLGPPLRPTQARMTPKIQEKAWGPSKTQGRTSSYPSKRKTIRDRTESHKKQCTEVGLECKPIGKCDTRRRAPDLRERTHERREQETEQESKSAQLGNKYAVHVLSCTMRRPMQITSHEWSQL